ncbi:MAG: hypothetical protein RRY29_03830 [Desulfovibrionaceae bacterium]
MMGLNLHGLVHPVIALVHPDETITMYQSMGQRNIKGKITPIYAAPQTVMAQVQAVGDAALAHADRVGQNDITRHFYLHATAQRPPAGVVRPLARGGDIFQRAQEHGGTWWLIIATPEEFSRVGWVCVRCSLQAIAPDFTASDWYTEQK